MMTLGRGVLAVLAIVLHLEVTKRVQGMGSVRCSGLTV
jgi:hypothetical protein